MIKDGEKMQSDDTSFIQLREVSHPAMARSASQFTTISDSFEQSLGIILSRHPAINLCTSFR